MIHTERLVLRPLEVGDAGRLLEFWNLPEVTYWLLRPTRTAGELHEFLRGVTEDLHDHSLAILCEGVVVGAVDLDLVGGPSQRGGPARTVAHVGYTIDPAHAGRGYATEAALAAMDHAFDQLGARRATATAYVDNVASVRILEKLGMRREGHGRRDAWHAELGWLDGCSYALLADERSPQRT